MPQMSPMSWSILSTIYFFMMMFLFSKMSKSNMKKEETKTQKIPVMKMEW